MLPIFLNSNCQNTIQAFPTITHEITLKVHTWVDEVKCVSMLSNVASVTYLIVTRCVLTWVYWQFRYADDTVHIRLLEMVSVLGWWTRPSIWSNLHNCILTNLHMTFDNIPLIPNRSDVQFTDNSKPMSSSSSGLALIHIINWTSIDIMWQFAGHWTFRNNPLKHTRMANF